jgi:hypothetical protein
MQRYSELDAKVTELARELPGITLGYIGNLETWGDDRAWFIFLPNHTDKARHVFQEVSVRDDWDWAKLEAEARRKYAAQKPSGCDVHSEGVFGCNACERMNEKGK